MKTAESIAEYRPFSPCEMAWVRKRHPALLVSDKECLLSGLLQFKAQYPDYNNKKLVLADEYQVEVRIGSNSLPYVWEVGGYLENRADEMEMKLEDMHVYPADKSICMATPISMRRIIRQHKSLQKKFIEGVFDNLIIPYFYYHTYWREYDREPWLGLAHGAWGFCQDYPNNPGMGVMRYLRECPPKVIFLVVFGRDIHANGKCPCGCSSAELCRCGAVQGFNALRKDYRSLPHAQRQELMNLWKRRVSKNKKR